MNNYEKGGIINVGSSEEISIRNLANLLAELTSFKGTIKFDSSKPDGTPRKLMDNQRVNKLGWKSKTTMKEGITKMYQSWLKEKKIKKDLERIPNYPLALCFYLY